MDSLASGPNRADALLGYVVDDRFELQAVAGAGGMGCVYRARDRLTGSPVAVKVLPADGDAARFAREAHVLSTLDHPSIVRHVGHGVTAEGWQYLAMEWLAGEDLARRLELGPLSVGETLLLATKVAESLGAAHARGVIHRDLKPGNLFLVGGRLDCIKLLDFGIARLLDGGDLTVSGTVIGTPQYMPPEQVRGAPVDARADVYGLGAVMFRCLTGRAPFGGAHQIAVLAKIVLEPPERLRTLCPDAPPQLEELLDRMLAKDPALRPRDCEALRQELLSLQGPQHPAAAHGVRGVVTSGERRVASIVLCARSVDEETTRRETLLSSQEDALMRTIRERGGVIDALARGAWVVTIPKAASPSEQALRAVRCATSLAATRPGVPVYVATGHLVVGTGQTMGEVIDRAADALVEATRSGAAGVWMDAATAELVEGHFLSEPGGTWRRLVQELDAVAPVRMLLGKPTPCVGRGPQVAMLATMLQSVVEQKRASSVVVTAPAGLGKTHLVHEFLRTGLSGAGSDVDLLVARGDAARSASPLGVVGQVFRRAAGVAEPDADGVRAKKLAALVSRDFGDGDHARVREVVAEICGVRGLVEDAGSALRAARSDPSVMGDAVRETWNAWLGARAAQGPVLLLLEDAHWADAPSLALLEDALVAHADAPLLLVATARPGTVAWNRLRATGLVEISLAPLSQAASEGLVRGALGANADEAAVRAIARRAGGHPFHLEEMIRAVAAGSGADALPDSVLGMVQARFDGLDARARRVLRAASVFGETFWPGGVASLLGDELSRDGLQALLASLVEGELVTRQRVSRWPGEPEYRFRHALLRDGAYATLPEDDRLRAHRRAASWLEEAGEQDPAVLAEHHDRGASPVRAVEFLRTAAQQALHRNDLASAMAHATRARSLGSSASVEAALCAVEAEVHYWRNELERAAARAGEARKLLPYGSHEWFDVVGIAIAALGQLGRNADVATLLEEVARVAPMAGGRGTQLVALSRGLVQLFWAHHGDGLPGVRARLDELASDAGELDAHHVAWVHRVRGESAWLHRHDAGLCLAEMQWSCEQFERAHALRAACLTRLNAASLRGWAGAPDEGLAMVARAREEAVKLGADFLLRYGRAVEGLLLAYAGRADAEATARDALAKVAGSPRLAFICRVVLGWLALEKGALEEASAQADAARAMPVAPELRPAGLALAARTLTALGRGDEAAALVEEAAREERALPDLELTWGMAGVALAEAKMKTDVAAARAALEPVLERLRSVALTLPSADDRRRFWTRPLPNARARALAESLGMRAEA